MGENNESIERKEDQQDERKHEPLTALIGGEPAPMLPVGVGPDGRVGLIHPENGAPPENKGERIARRQNRQATKQAISYSDCQKARVHCKATNRMVALFISKHTCTRHLSLNGNDANGNYWLPFLASKRRRNW